MTHHKGTSRSAAKRTFSMIELRQSDNSPYRELLPAIEKADSVLIAAPIPHTVDALCAGLVLQQALGEMGKQATLAVPGGVNETHEWIAGAENVKGTLAEDGDFVITLSTERASVDRLKYTLRDQAVDIIITPKDGHFSPADVAFTADTTKYDLIIVLGANRVEDLGDLWAENTRLFATTPVVSFGVNMAQKRFGLININQPSLSSVSEAMYGLLRSFGEGVWTMTEETSSILLAGIISATGSFLEQNTTPSSLRIASELQASGADQSFVIEKLFKSKTLPTLMLWGDILNNLSLDRMHQIAWSRLTIGDLHAADATVRHVKDMSDTLLRHINGAEISALFLEQPNEVMIEVRSTNQAHLFESLQHSDEYVSVRVPHGVNLRIPNKTLSEVETRFLEDLLQFQKVRHGLPEKLPLTKANLVQEAKNGYTEEESSPKKKRQRVRSGKKKEWNETTIPFTAPSKKRKKE